MSERAPLAELFLFHSLDLDNHMILNNHANFTVTNALDGMPDLLDDRIGGRIGG